MNCVCRPIISRSVDDFLAVQLRMDESKICQGVYMGKCPDCGTPSVYRLRENEQKTEELSA